MHVFFSFFLQAGLARQSMQCQPLRLILPADPDRLAVADWSVGWRRIIRPWLGSEEECCDRLAMPALGLGMGEMHVFALLAQVA